MARVRVAVVAVAIASSAAFSLAPRDGDPAARRTLQARTASPRPESVSPDAATPSGEAARAFLARHGGQWDFQADRRTGRATLIEGSGIRLLPRDASLRDTDGNLSIDAFEPLGRALVELHRAWLAPRFGRLVLDRATSLVLENGRLVSLHWNWLVGDVPVEGAGVFVNLNSGSVTQLGAPLVSDAEPASVPALDADEARRRLVDWSGDAELARAVGEPRLLIEVDETPAGSLVYRLVWVLRYKTPSRIETWEGRVDALTGEIVAFADANAYGQVTGGIHPRTVIDPETRVPFPFARVTSGAPLTASAAGAYAYGGGLASSGLTGLYFDANCLGCTNPGQPFVETGLGTGRLDFGLGGVDQVGNGRSTPADRNAFFHLNQVRRIGKKWLPSLAWLDTTIATNVNIVDVCNAFYDGTVNFFRSGGGCNNTGEIADVMQHEWGHGLDGNTRGGDGATGEATADVVAMHMTHDARIGPYFRTTGAPVRDLEKTRTAKGLITRTNIATKCPAGTGPLGFEVHCEGEIYGQTAWDLSQALTAKHGPVTGWRASEKIFFTSLVNAGSYLATGTFPIYSAYIQADDDDGNLANGTPNGGEIYAAFSAHEIAGTPRTSSPGCTRPAQPVLAVTPACDRFTLSWNVVAGIDHYEVFRTETIPDAAFFKLGNVASAQTSYVDTVVAPGVDYTYVVMAVTAAGCESTIESPVAARLVPQPILAVAAVSPDDLPRGNRSGFADPGEEVDLHVTLSNFGDLASTGAGATLVPDTPGVTILGGSDAWPGIPPGGADVNSGVLRFDTDELVRSCGDTLRFHVVPAGGSSCASETSYFDVVLGDRATVRAESFEVDTDWAVDAAASTATAGAWTRGDPDATAFQPGDDVSDPGTLCWFTASNAGGEGVDDVDNGVTVLRSPVIDLTGAAGARLSFWRWFANRDLGEDAGDFFKADVSSNGGSSWVNLETLGTNESAAMWTRREFKIEDFVPLTANFRIRFQVADGTVTGNLIEGAVDEVRIERPVCDATPACFTPATFAGLAGASSGSSCGETDLGWTAATSNCQNATIRYNVYRSTDPAFVPNAANRIAAGLVGTSFHDALLAPGATYHYIVRADDSRSGEDANLVRRTVVSPASPDLAPPIFAGLASATAGAGCGEVVLGWVAALESCNTPVSYEVYRSTDPSFVPGPATLLASTLSAGLVDIAPSPNASFTYVVRAKDAAGNEGANPVRLTVVSKALDKPLFAESFESGSAGWAVGTPNDAITGQWELGDPQATAVQPGDDATPDPGVNAWITGLAAGAGDGDFDVDTGTTTLVSAAYDLSGAVDPVARYARWYSNDGGANPGEDLFDVHVSNNNGGTWALVEQVGAVPLGWTVASKALNGTTTPTAQMRFRFTARDLGVGGSLVEAGIDDFSLVDRNQGCGGCPVPAPAVGTIFVARSGQDVVLDWSGDPSSASRYVVYELVGPAFDQAVRIGTTTSKGFVHAGAATSGQNFAYRVSAVDPCGVESAR